ncbi:spore coat protein [Heliophilum fasciatum]|uniref:Coat F domain-containing protein n=1 Tax=Heliophilum fasciatum TaxID=35700 RepID=A0A4R2S0K6_9FIRM|nr:ferritin-like domain-containing protein [Heliophilum fasciatum]MCW2276670.1 spore coat protein CotF [Heliophilum fasciatum]TCP68949.1 coat F domain-containing protein [Heliophilum fasciatum]
MLQLTQRERGLLEDQQSHEQLCVYKYKSYAQQAQDPVLKQMFQKHAQHEQQHLNTVNQILSGQVPAMNQQQGQQLGQQQGQQQQSMQQSPNMQQQNMASQGLLSSVAGSSSQANEDDLQLCRDMLVTEQYISSSYDSAIFQFNNPQVRQAFNHIQKEEQQHGQELLQYLQQNSIM